MKQLRGLEVLKGVLGLQSEGSLGGRVAMAYVQAKTFVGITARNCDFAVQSRERSHVAMPELPAVRQLQLSSSLGLCSTFVALFSGRRSGVVRTRMREAALGTVIGCNGTAFKKRPQYIPNRIDDPSYVRIFDTTLRDGEQSPGATMRRRSWILPGSSRGVHY